jgi:hypothetical protein
MAEFVILLLIGMGYLACCVGVRLYRFLRWLISPILEEIRHRRVLEQERQKEERLLEAHQRAREAIDRAVARCVGQHEQAAARSDRQSRRR